MLTPARLNPALLRLVATFSGLSIGASLLLCAQPSHALNLVTNGDFETGDFTGWTLSGNTGFTSVQNTPTCVFGSQCAFVGPIGSLGYLVQNLATTPGQIYDISFDWFTDGGIPNVLAMSFEGNTLFSISDVLASGTYTGQVTATTSGSLLSFSYQNDPSYNQFDNVSVTPVPGPLPLLGVAAAFGYSRKLRKSMQTRKLPVYTAID
jgi:hypothetical protein